MSLDFKDYTVEDFVIDKNFRDWVLHPGKSSNLFWEKWIDANPERVDDLKKARETLLNLSRIDYQPGQGDEEVVWQRIAGVLDEDEEEPAVVPIGPGTILSKYYSKRRNYPGSWFYRVVASIVVVIAVFSIYRYFVNQMEDIGGVVITKTNPRGQKSTVFLPDGSKVNLNSESSLWYLSDYDLHERTVHLSGEAFFEVTRDSLRPFTVVTEHLSTTAIGTSFNVSAYSPDDQEVSLMTGKVKVLLNNKTEAAILYPGEQVTLKGSGTLVKGKFDRASKVLWKDQIIYFKDTPVKEILQTLERWYNVTFEVENGIPDVGGTGTFENDYLSNVLNSLGYTLGFTYKIEDKKVMLKFNQSN